jgi:hypothetical protein
MLFDRLEREVRDLRQKLTEAEANTVRLKSEIGHLKEATDTERRNHKSGFDEGFAAGRKAGLADAQTSDRAAIHKLQSELETYRAACPWSELVERYCHKHPLKKDRLRITSLKYRFSTNKLTAEDQAMLRRFSESKPVRKRKVAA